MLTLYQALQAEGVPTDNHESDLYFQDSPTARAVLLRYPGKMQIASRFRNQADPHKGETWVEVPFAFDPWWEARKAP